MAEITAECPHCRRTLDEQYETAFILIPRLDSVRYNMIVVRTIIARIQTQATIYQPEVRRLCGEAEYLLSQNVNGIRSIIEQARHYHPQPHAEDPPPWW